MAEDIVTSRDERDQAKPLLRELAQELALCDALKYKHATLLDNVPAHNAAKSKSIVEEYNSAVETVNETAAEHMDREIQAMDRFTEEVRAFNDLCTDYTLAIALLRAMAKGGE